MNERLPLSKPELKKMFLRVLFECLYGNMQSNSPGIDSIVPRWMNEYFRMEMYPEEIQLTHEAIQELKSSGLIVQDPSQYSDVFQILTAKGKDIVEKQQDPDVYALRLEQVLKNGDLLHKCLDLFNGEKYDSAVFSAFKLVEEAVRAKAGLSEEDFGVNLMSKAFNPSTGKLSIPTLKLPAEQEGIHSLFRGAIAVFKNPSSHRTINYESRFSVLQTIVVAELLLNIVATAQLKWHHARCDAHTRH